MQAIFLPLAGGFSPASGCGSLRGWRQGVRGASPSTPPTTPVLPLSVWWRASLPYDVSPALRSPQGIASAPRLAGLRGSFRPARTATGSIFSGMTNALCRAKKKERGNKPTPCQPGINSTCLPASSAQRTESIKESLLPHLKRRLSPNLRKTDTTILPV